MSLKNTILICILSLFVSNAYSQHITELGKWENNSNFDIHYHNGVLTTTTTSGTRLLDVSNPANISVISNIANPMGFPNSMTRVGDYVYLGGGMVGYLMIVDISNPGFPVQRGITYDLGTTYSIAIKGDYAFVTAFPDSLHVIDISNKNQPFLAKSLYMGGFALDILIKDNLAYVATRDGLKMVDITNPLNPVILNSFGDYYEYISVDEENRRLFVSKGNIVFGFDVIDIADPLNPAVLFPGIGGNSYGKLDYKNGHIFQVGGNNVSVFRINPNSVSYLATFDSTISGGVRGVVARDSVFYVTSGNHVHVLQLNGSFATRVPKNPEFANFSVYPNPANHNLTIENPIFTSSWEMAIYNMNGQKVKESRSENPNMQIDISGMETGMYVIYIYTEFGVQRLKFVKE